MTFTRTISGVANFAKFTGSDIMVYTEGKTISSNSDHVFDELFYQALIGYLYPDKKLKIKCVGSRTVALEYAKILDTAGSTESVVIVDRDGEDLVSFLFQKRNIIYTDGYSWENDFWTQEIACKVVEELACTGINDKRICTQFRLLSKRLSHVSAFDISAHINMEALLPKNGGGCGIGFDFKSQYVLLSSEIRRLKEQYRRLAASECDVCKSILPEAVKANNGRVIQGHLWEHVVLNLIGFAISGSRKAKVPHYLVKNLAMSKFQQSPASYMNQSTISYYRDELRLRF